MKPRIISLHAVRIGFPSRTVADIQRTDGSVQRIDGRPLHPGTRRGAPREIAQRHSIFFRPEVPVIRVPRRRHSGQLTSTCVKPSARSSRRISHGFFSGVAIPCRGCTSNAEGATKSRSIIVRHGIPEEEEPCIVRQAGVDESRRVERGIELGSEHGHPVRTTGKGQGRLPCPESVGGLAQGERLRERERATTPTAIHVPRFAGFPAQTVDQRSR